MELFDSHAHYNDEKFKQDQEEILESIYKTGITKLICAGYSLESSKKATEIADKYAFIYSIVGISPNDIAEELEEVERQLEEIEQLARKNKVVAIGEIGLDYYWNTDNKEMQLVVFQKQIQLANRLSLPIVIHTREAVMDTIQILKMKTVDKKGVFHCCPMNRELVKEALKLGFYISLAGPVTFKNAKNADEIIQMIPIDRILIETDSPYLAPEPNRGKRNDSRNVIYIAEKIAQVRKMPVEEIARITYENTCRVFNIKS